VTRYTLPDGTEATLNNGLRPALDGQLWVFHPTLGLLSVGKEHLADVGPPPFRCNHIYDHPELGIHECGLGRRHVGPHHSGDVTWTMTDHREPDRTSETEETPA
jgi:hypothetical protein